MSKPCETLKIIPRHADDKISERYGKAVLFSGAEEKEYVVGENATRIVIASANSVNELEALEAGFVSGVCLRCKGDGCFACNGTGRFDTAIEAFIADWNERWPDHGWTSNPRVWIIEP